MKTLYLLVRVVIVVIAMTLLTALALLTAAGWTLKAQPDEWSIPLQIGRSVPGGSPMGVRIEAGVAMLLRLATHAVGLLLLDGHALTTPYGTLHVSRVASPGDDAAFAIDCRPCRLKIAALGNEPLALASVHITGTQRADTLHGTIAAGRLSGRYSGRFDARTLTLDVRIDRAPIADYYQVFGANVPELARAEIAGTAALSVRLALPSANVSIRPTIEGFSVSGLGTERFAGRLPTVTCGVSHQSARSTDFGFWLPHAVIAAEDQRYYEHPGYDLDELLTSLDRNQSSGRVERGASTIPQQLAKLLQVGSDRTVSRKLRELLYASEMEQTLGKARMLQLYLSVVPWGEGTCGAEAAAMHYFNVPPKKLSGAQAAWLAAMLHAPDREAARWAAAGRIDLPRATWVAKGMQRVGPDARRRVRDELATMAPGAVAPRIVASARDRY